jgi:hypothetical protein
MTSATTAPICCINRSEAVWLVRLDGAAGAGIKARRSTLPLADSGTRSMKVTLAGTI